MAESRSVAVVCKMALMKEGLWSIVDGKETNPPAEKYTLRA